VNSHVGDVLLIVIGLNIDSGTRARAMSILEGRVPYFQSVDLNDLEPLSAIVLRDNRAKPHIVGILV
jgi:hypothetical protein